LDTDPTFGVFFMAKYSERFRRRVVEEYLAGESGYRALGARYGVGFSMVRRWVASYRVHGVAGLRKKYSHYDAQFKLSVLQRMWQDELSYTQVTALFDLRNPRGVATWERLYHEGGIDALAPRPRGRCPKMNATQPDKPAEGKTPEARTREELLKENEYLRAEVAYLKKLDALLKEKARAAQRKKRK
jgi:transposase